jgi:hypothetical protein
MAAPEDRFIVGQEAWFYENAKFFQHVEAQLFKGDIQSPQNSSFNNVRINGGIYDAANFFGNVGDLVLSDGKGGWYWGTVGYGTELQAAKFRKTSLTEDINVIYANRVPIRFDSEVYKTDFFTHSNTSNSQRVTIGNNGIYIINVNIGIDNTGAGDINPIASIFLNGVEVTQTRSTTYSGGTAAGNDKNIQIATQALLVAGDYIEVYAWMDQADQTTAVNTIVNATEFSILKAATRGPQGVQGLQGLQGVIGIQGAQGSQGVQGNQGVQGLSNQGIQGLQGIQGVQGTQGIQGIQGIQGPLSNFQGTQGTQGLQGVQGLANQGVQGTQGMQGTQGLQGIQGVQGQSNQGIQGTQGIQGDQGVQGVQGTQGLSNQGAQGTQGVQGDQGVQGVQGVQGEQGVQGLIGEQGVQGTQGTQGVQGEQGEQGVQGLQGLQGLQGVQGVQGQFGPVAGDPNQVVYKNPQNQPAGSENFKFYEDESLVTVGEQSGAGIVSATTFKGEGSQITGIVTSIIAGIGIDIESTQLQGKGIVEITSYRPVGRTIYVSMNGDDDNTGLAENYPKKTIKAATAIAVFGDTIKVFPGTYIEENPITLAKTVSVEGTELRNVVITPRYPDRDLFYVNNGCHITDCSFIGQSSTNGASIVSLQPLRGIAPDRYFDGARMVRFNLDYIAKESVGFLTSGFSGFAGNHREQDAARLIDSNTSFIAAESVGFLTSPLGYNFSLDGSTYENCKEDIVSIMDAVAKDLKANSNRNSIGAGYSYFNSFGSLIHITGIATQQATIAALDYAAGISSYVINNQSLPTSYQSGVGSISQTLNNSVILVSGGCVSVGTTIGQLVGIVTNMIGAASTLTAPPVRYGVNLDSEDCADDIKNIYKAVCFDITRGGNSKCVTAGRTYFDENFNLIPSILKNPQEVQQTIATLDYSFNIARSVVNNCTWGGYPVGLGTTVVNAVYDANTGLTTITAINHGFIKDDPIKISGLLYECDNGSPGFAITVSTATYDRITGISTITLSQPLDIVSGNRVRLQDLVFVCDSGGGPSTASYPSGNLGYDFTVLDVIDPPPSTTRRFATKFTVNVGTSTLDHTYVSGGTVKRLYTPIFGVSTAFYDRTTGITTVTAVGLGTTTGPALYIEPGQKVKLENLVFVCDSGGGPATAYYPSGNLGYDFKVISTTDDRYVDAANLIEANRNEIVDKSLAAIAVAYPDFYYPNDLQTTRFSRYKDSYRLIQQNREEIINTSWNNTVSVYPGISTTEGKCKRDLGYFVDAVSTDVFTGGNTYTIQFTKKYFDGAGNPISNGLVGEVTESVYAFNQARDLMKLAITNNLTVRDLTITADPGTGINTSTASCANVQQTINTLVSIATTTITNGSLILVNNIRINNGIFAAGENKCRRDLGYIVDALTKDVKYGTNKHIREATRAYFTATGSPISNGLVGETAQSIVGFHSVRDYAKLAITNQLNNRDLSIIADPITGSNTSPSSCADVQSNIDNLVGILTTTVGLGTLSSFPTLYVSNKVKVNVGVSTLDHIYVTGGTVTANYTTKTFPDGTYNYIFPVKSVVGPNTFTFVGGKAVLPHTYVSGGTVQKYSNFQSDFTQVKDMSMQVDPETGYNDAINSCSNVISAIRSCVGVVTTIVGLGSTSNISITYPGNAGYGFTDVIGVSSAIYEEDTGKTTITSPGLVVRKGDPIELKDLVFSCNSGIITSTQKFPSGRYGYEFQVDKVYQDGSFDIYVGTSTLPHTYVSGGTVVNRSVPVSFATYDNITGITTITAPGAYVKVGEFVSIRDLEFVCTSGAGTTTIYPTSNTGYDFTVLDVIGYGTTFVVNVGPTIRPHQYLTGGVVIPQYSKGVGPITQGPYVRNATNFVPASIGMKVDGIDAEPGDQDDIGVTGTMSVDSYTQYNQGGIGVSITNGAYSQLVSIFTICDDIAIYTAAGGQCDLTNSNSSFGNFGLVSVGIGDQTSKSIYRYTGNTISDALVDQDVIVVAGVGTYRPYDGQALYFGEVYYTVLRIDVTDGGSGYIFPPNVIITPPDGPNGIPAEGSANIDEAGRVTSVDVISTGAQYITPPIISFSPVGGLGSGAAATTVLAPIYYAIQSATKPVAGISTIVLLSNLNSTVSAGTTVYFSRVSLQITSSHSFEWVGSGVNINSAKPALGGVTIQENEVVQEEGGIIVYTSTDQGGNFKIGDDVTINQVTGTITGRAFSQSLLNTVTPLIIALGK